MISEGVSGVYRDGTVNRQPGQHTPAMSCVRLTVSTYSEGLVNCRRRS